MSQATDFVQLFRDRLHPRSSAAKSFLHLPYRARPQGFGVSENSRDRRVNAPFHGRPETAFLADARPNCRVS